MRTLAITLLLLCLSPNLWALDSLGRWVSETEHWYNIEDAVGGFKTASPSENGNLREMKVRLEILTASHNVKCAIYHWPDTVLVDSTEIVSCGADTAWYTFKFIDSAMIYSDSDYALVATAEDADGTAKISYSLSGGNWIYDLIRVYGVWPDPFTTFDHTNATPCNIYATYEPTAAATGTIIIIQH